MQLNGGPMGSPWAIVDTRGRVYVDTILTDVNTGSVVGTTYNDGSNCLNVINPDIYASGILSGLNAELRICSMNQSSALLTCSGLWKGKIFVEGTIDESLWNNISLFQPTGQFTREGIMNDNQNGMYRVALVATYKAIRARMESYTSGAALIQFNLSSQPGTNYVWQLNQANLKATTYQGGSRFNGFIDTLGSTYGYKMADGLPRVSSMPYLYSIAEGQVSGHTSWSKSSYNNSIGTTMEDMWGLSTIYNFPPSGMTMYVVSTSTADTQSGLGVQAMIVRYLDNNYLEKSEIVTMSGTTIIPTLASDIYRINSFRATNCGASGMSLGNISIGSGTNYYSYMGSNFTRARNNCYTVPSGNTLYVTSIAFSASSAKAAQPANVRFTTKANIDDLGSQIDLFMPYSEVILQDTAYTKTLEMPTKLPSRTDIKVGVVASTAGAEGTCALRGWLETD